MALPGAEVQHRECHHHFQRDESSPVPPPACSDQSLSALLLHIQQLKLLLCLSAQFPILWHYAHCIFNLNQKYIVVYFIMLQTTICILYLIKFFCHFPYDFCILHVPEHFNSYRTCNVMKEQKKLTQHGFATSKYQCFSAAEQTAQWYI